MLREPRKAEHTVQVRKDKKSGRFQFVKLEERIAPTNCHYNPQGKKVGCGNTHNFV
jgi:hypothetical protein